MWITAMILTNISWLCVVIVLAHMVKKLNASNSALLTQGVGLAKKAEKYDKIAKDGLAGKHLRLHQENGALQAELKELKGDVLEEPDKADRLITKLEQAAPIVFE